MNRSSGTLADFYERYAVESLPDGEGVLIDLQTGNYFKLNVMATVICEALQFAKTFEDAISRVAGKTKVPVAEAARLLQCVRESLSHGTIPQNACGPLRYVSQMDGSASFEEEGRTIFSVAPGGRTVRFRASLNELSGPLVFYLQALVPKLLALLEVPVLHAAACQVGGSLLAISGRSGAGKTTTAHAFERAGATLISEDLVVLSRADEWPLMYTRGERFTRDWAVDTAPRLESAPGQEIDFGALSEAQRGSTIPLVAMWFIDIDRRAGTSLKLRKLSTGDGILALLGNGMLATSHARHWRDFLRRSRLIAERTDLSEASMPQGISQLDAAVEAYIVKSAS